MKVEIFEFNNRIEPKQESKPQEEETKQDQSAAILALNAEYEEQIKNLKSDNKALTTLCQEYCSRIEKVKNHGELTEDKILTSQSFKSLVAQA